MKGRATPLPPAAGQYPVRRAADAQGRVWELVVRVEPLPGCAADVPPGFRISLLTFPLGAGGEATETVRVTGDAVWASWEEADAAARALAARLAGISQHRPNPDRSTHGASE